MSAAHTPGPWRIEPMKHTLGLAVWSGTPNGADEFRVAGVAGIRGAAEANARLIAAAPDLLEALKAALAELERSNRVMRQEVGVTVCNEAVLQQVREAIAKAVTA